MICFKAIRQQPFIGSFENIKCWSPWIQLGQGKARFVGRAAQNGASIKNSGLKRYLRFFYKEVHPDLTPAFPELSKKVNEDSLGQLNAYIDFLNNSKLASRLEIAPFVEKPLCFFKTYKTRSGKLVEGRVQPFFVKLPSVRIGSTYIERETIAAKLVLRAERNQLLNGCASYAMQTGS